MWDVKLAGVKTVGKYVLFYLNYVGCKVRQKAQEEGFEIEFYLNYVGCKGCLS